MRTKSFKVACTIAATEDLETDSCDIKGAYLNSELQEDIYMQQPPGYNDKSGRVWHLIKALYGLKQAGKAWNDKFNHTLMTTLGFTRSTSDPCLYHKRGTKLLIILIHVDDTAIFSTRDDIDAFKADLQKHFEITDLGDLKSFLGLQIKRNRDSRTIFIHQEHYLQSVLTRFQMETCNAASTPLDPKDKLTPLSPEDEEEVANVPYPVAIGSLMYAAVATRPDIAFAVQHLAQFTSRPSQAHWRAVKHVLRYIKGYTRVGIILEGPDLSLIRYSDADWAANLADRRSVSGYLFKLGDGSISWSSKKQATVALSTMEAEYIAIAHAAKEAL